MILRTRVPTNQKKKPRKEVTKYTSPTHFQLPMVAIQPIFPTRAVHLNSQKKMKPARNLDSATTKDTDGRENQFNVVKALDANEKRSDTRLPRKYIFTFRRRWRPHRASVCVFSGLSSPDAAYEYFPEEKRTKRQPGPERIALQNEFRVFAVVPWLVDSTAIPSYLVSFHTVPSTSRLLVSRPFE